jgi:DDE domain
MGQTLDLLRTQERDAQAAKRFLPTAIRRHGVLEKRPRDGSAANAAALQSDNEAPGTAIARRPVQELTQMVEQAHRGVQRGTRAMVGGKSCDAAQGPLVGLERMPRIKQTPLGVEAGDEGRPAAARFSSLAASSSHRQAQLPRHDLLDKICDITTFAPSTAASIVRGGLISIGHSAAVCRSLQCLVGEGPAEGAFGILREVDGVDRIVMHGNHPYREENIDTVVRECSRREHPHPNQ